MQLLSCPSLPRPVLALAEKNAWVKIPVPAKTTAKIPLLLKEREDPKVWEMAGSKAKNFLFEQPRRQGVRRETKAQRADLHKSLLMRKVHKNMFNFTPSH